MGLLSMLFGKKPTLNFSDLMSRGAVIIDVRTAREFQSGHIKEAINIPVDKISSQLKKLKKDVPVITCCASGMRSASAAGILKRNGYECYNGGAWQSLRNKLSK